MNILHSKCNGKKNRPASSSTFLTDFFFFINNLITWWAGETEIGHDFGACELDSIVRVNTEARCTIHL